MSTVLRNAFMPIIILPTRVTSHTCTLIDHIFYYSKTHGNNIFSGNVFLDITDHFANFLIFGPKKNHEKPYVRIFSDKNKRQIKDSLQSINWEQELCNKNTNQSMSYFYEQLIKTYNKSFPLLKLSDKRRNDKP